MSYDFAYSHERIQDGLNESAVEVSLDGKVIARFAVIGYNDATERKAMAKSFIEGLLPVIEKQDADEKPHPVMTKSDSVDDKDIGKAEASTVKVL